MGHSAHVTNVRWTSNDGQLVSIGGADTALLLWSHGTNNTYSRGESDDSDTDSEEEGGM